ncbi:helix-turn-helix domain-containing protein, partial [Klebsiella pneumoniae]|nr:helix-turn-helix domain-containing protein [Klebsiella pneumoniae]
EVEKPKLRTLPERLNLAQTADYLHLSETQVLNLISDGELKAKATEGDYLISRASIKHYKHS